MISSWRARCPWRNDPDQREQDQQHGEDGQERRIGDLAGQLPGPVVGVLAHHGARDGGGRPAPLPPVEAVDR